ncbi:MAG: nucleotidyltransferase family protein [Pseudomonadota bacterium]
MRNHPNALMLFAAGFGTRMRPLTNTTPKPLISVAGRPLLDHALEQIGALRISTRVVNTHHLADQMAVAASERRLSVSHETPDVLETGGGLRAAMPVLGEPEAVFTMNTDAVWTGPPALETLAEAWDPYQMDGLLLLVPPDRAVGHALKSGFTMDGFGRLRRSPTLAFTGAQILKTAPVMAETAPAFSLNRTWDRLLPTGRLFGVIHPGFWCDVGRPEGIAEAEVMVATRV